jgi:hypothetical protein
MYNCAWSLSIAGFTGNRVIVELTSATLCAAQHAVYLVTAFTNLKLIEAWPHVAENRPTKQPQMPRLLALQPLPTPLRNQRPDGGFHRLAASKHPHAILLTNSRLTPKLILRP